ncbi:hypothetical protein QDZ86_005449 [Pluralibacter gergoviae]
MTSKLINDRLTKILHETQQAITEHNARCVRGSVEVDARLFESMLIEMQGHRKAVMECEPVRYMNKFTGTCVALEQQPDADDDAAVYVPLYTSPQPAPVVPEEITSASTPEVFEIAAEAERLGLRGTYASYAVGWNAAIAWVKEMNKCL